MIRIQDKKDCCGCTACASVCPVSCIQMKEDPEGFLYPEADGKTCTDCGACERVCPCLNRIPAGTPGLVFSVKTNREDLRRQSSSGGLFSELAGWVIRQGGVVFGARFSEDWTVVHDCTDKIEGLGFFRGSKYVQSRMGDAYKQARAFLQQGRWVLFTGTPCQIAGLNLFLRKKYDRLLTADVVCHGAPSPKVWRKYLKSLTGGKTDRITDIRFRSKQTGWKNYSFVCKWDDAEYQETGTVNLYMKGFLRGLCLRPSCHYCPGKMFASGSDLTLADYWGVEVLQPELDDDSGIGLVFAHTEKSLSVLDELDITKRPVPFGLDTLVKYNPSIRVSAKLRDLKRRLFFCGIDTPLSVILLLKVFTKRFSKGKLLKALARRI